MLHTSHVRSFAELKPSRAQLEFFSVQSPYNTPAFFDCLTPYPFTHTRLAQIIQKSQSQKNKAGLISDAEETVAQFGIFGVPLIAATRPDDGMTQAWFGQDKIESIGWWLGKCLIQSHYTRVLQTLDLVLMQHVAFHLRRVIFRAGIQMEWASS